MAINVSVQHNGGFLPGIIPLTQCYYHRGTRLNAMERFVSVAYDFFKAVEKKKYHRIPVFHQFM